MGERKGKYIIVGGGIAGVTAALTLRREDPEGEIILLAAEPTLPYNRPQLTAYLAGTATEAELALYPADWYRQQGIELHLGLTVTEVAPEEQEVVAAPAATATPSSSPLRLTYAKLLLAPGANAFLPSLPGLGGENVFTLRTLADATALRAYARTHPGPALVVGGGLLGLEAARALSLLGLEVTVLEHNQWLLPRQLDREGAAILSRQLAALGIAVQVGVDLSECLGTPPRRVRLSNGLELPVNLMLVSAGIRADLTLARQAGLACHRGISVDSRLRTSAPNIWAAGDVAEFNGIVYGIVPAAREQAQVAARNMVGREEVSYPGTAPSTSLKVAGIKLVSLGVSSGTGLPGAEEIVVRDAAAGIYKKAVLQEGKLVGAILLGDTREAPRLTRLLHSGERVGKKDIWREVGA